MIPVNTIFIYKAPPYEYNAVHQQILQNERFKNLMFPGDKGMKHDSRIFIYKAPPYEINAVYQQILHVGHLNNLRE